MDNYFYKSFSRSNSAEPKNKIDGSKNNISEVINGTEEDDILRGGRGDIVNGNGGNDIFYLRGGAVGGNYPYEPGDDIFRILDGESWVRTGGGRNRINIAKEASALISLDSEGFTIIKGFNDSSKFLLGIEGDFIFSQGAMDSHDVLNVFQRGNRLFYQEVGQDPVAVAVFRDDVNLTENNFI